MAEASLEGIPTSISPIAMTSRSESVTPPADAAELCENANKALKELLTTKASIDTCRWRAIWKLGMELHWNESQVTKSIKEAKAVCSQVTLDAQALCFATIKEAKAICCHVTLDAKAICCHVTLDAKAICSHVTLDAEALCLMTVKEAKTTWAHTIQEAKAACYMVIRNAETQRASQAKLLQREHGKIMYRTWRCMSHLRGGQKSSWLPLCLPGCNLYTSSTKLKGTLVASYHVLLRTGTSISAYLPYHKEPLQWRNCLLELLLLHQWPSSLLGPKDGTLLQILWRAHNSGWNHI